MVHQQPKHMKHHGASLRIARAGKPHTIGEQLCLPLAKEMTQIMCRKQAAKKFNFVQLANDTVSRRITDVGHDVKKTLIERVKKVCVLPHSLMRWPMMQI